MRVGGRPGSGSIWNRVIALEGDDVGERQERLHVVMRLTTATVPHGPGGHVAVRGRPEIGNGGRVAGHSPIGRIGRGSVAGRRSKQVLVGGKLSHRESVGLLAGKITRESLAEPRSLTRADRHPASQVGQGKVVDSVAAEPGTEDREKLGVLENREKLAVTERPAAGHDSAGRKDAYLTDVRHRVGNIEHYDCGIKRKSISTVNEVIFVAQFLT
jgi:hypothetical protein